jgi:hypothetical protein
MKKLRNGNLEENGENKTTRGTLKDLQAVTA